MTVPADLRRDDRATGRPTRERTLIPRVTFLTLLVEGVAVKLGDLVARDAGQPMEAVCVLANHILDVPALHQLSQDLMGEGRTQVLIVDGRLFLLLEVERIWEGNQNILNDIH